MLCSAAGRRRLAFERLQRLSRQLRAGPFTVRRVGGAGEHDGRPQLDVVRGVVVVVECLAQGSKQVQSVCLPLFLRSATILASPSVTSQAMS